MKISKITIHNFRSIKKLVLDGPVNDVWTLIGQNNAGKSSIFYAIRAFYGDYEVTVDDFCRSASDSEPIDVCIDFVLSDEERELLPKYYQLPESKLKVIGRFTRERTKGEWHGYELKEGLVTEREEEFFGAKNVLIGKLGEVIYVPAVKELSEELKKTKSSIFTKLVSRILSETLTSLPSWNGLVHHAQKFAVDLRSPVKDSQDGDIKSVHEIENKLGEMLKSWQLKPQILVSPPTPEDIILSGAQLKLIGEESGQEENPLTLGSGAQRSIVNSLLLLWAQVESKKTKTDKKKFNGQLTLLLYEEPEALLHFDQIKKLSKYLEDIARSPSSQVIVCTHSPDFVSIKRDALGSIARLSKERGETKLSRPSSEFLDELKISQNEFDFILWLNPDRNTMFFVDKVILVEGASDKAFLNYLIQENNIDANVYVIDCGLKSNIPRFMKLCDEFGVKHAVMFDRDEDRDDDHRTWNSSIHDASTILTKGYKDFPNDLETYIGFSIPEDNYMKPIEILRQLREGKLQSDHKNEFISFIKE